MTRSRWVPNTLVLITLAGIAGCAAGGGANSRGPNPAPAEPAPPAAPPPAQAGVPELCKLPPESGPCEALIQAWHFDAKTGSCRVFDYGGCEGNANNFDSEDACKAACGAR